MLVELGLLTISCATNQIFGPSKVYGLWPIYNGACNGDLKRKQLHFFMGNILMKGTSVKNQKQRTKNKKTTVSRYKNHVPTHSKVP